MADPQEPTAHRLNVEVPGDLAATYANFAVITHSPWEFFLDFAQILPQLRKARVQTRLVLTPTNAKMLLAALQENIARYESQNGEIKLPPRPSTLADQLFRSIRGDEGDDNPEGDADDDAQR